MPRSKLKINKTGRECSVCGAFKKWRDFVRARSSNTGYTAQCKICVCKYHREHYAKRFAAGGVPKEISPVGKRLLKDVNMKFLISLGQLSKKSWTYPQAAKLLDGLNRETEAGNYDFNSIYKQYAPDKSLWSCHAMRIELTKAAKNGMSLRVYWNNGRPFSAVAAKNRIIVPGKNAKKS